MKPFFSSDQVFISSFRGFSNHRFLCENIFFVNRFIFNAFVNFFIERCYAVDVNFIVFLEKNSGPLFQSRVKSQNYGETQFSIPNATSFSLFLSPNVFFSIYKTSAKTALNSPHIAFQRSGYWFRLNLSRILRWKLILPVTVSGALDLIFSLSRVFFTSESLKCIYMSTLL